MKDIKFCLAFIHDPGAFHGNKKIVVPDDLKGMKIRPAQSTIGEWSRCSAAPTCRRRRRKRAT